MAYRETAVDPTPHVPGAVCMPAAPDWQRLCGQALVRAQTAEARVAELKSAELAARSSAATY